MLQVRALLLEHQGGVPVLRRGDQPDAAQQQVGDGQHQQQAVKTVGAGHLNVAQGPAAAFPLAVAAQLLDARWPCAGHTAC